MITRSALVALMREAGVSFVEGRSRVMVDISTVSVESLQKFRDLALVYFTFKFSNPRKEVSFQKSAARETIRYYPIVEKPNGVFSNLAA